MDTFKLYKLVFIFLAFLLSLPANADRPGPDYIYKCSQCQHYLKRGSLMSGNTLGAKLYSDGKMIARMLPEFPNLTKCSKCGCFLIINNLESVGTCDRGEKCEEFKGADEVEFLSLDDLLKVLDTDLAKVKENEKLIRRSIWWAYNDRVRSDDELFVNSEDEIIWKNNCLRLVALLNKEDINEKIMTAELYRNLGEFDECMNLINEIKGSDRAYMIKKIFRAECEKKNRLVIRLFI